MPATGHEVVSQYFEAVKSGDYRGAYALVAPFGDYEGQRLVKAGWSYERFARKAPDSPVPQEWTIKEVSDTGPDSRWVSVEIHPTPFWAMQVSFDGVHLVSIDGEWYLKEPPFLGVMPES